MFALIFGGSGSGKSEYAEKLSCELAQKNEKYYIATMIPYGEEGKKRVERHKKLREGKDFYTIEQTMPRVATNQNMRGLVNVNNHITHQATAKNQLVILIP